MRHCASSPVTSAS